MESDRIVYPERHPHSEELKAKKVEIDELYKNINTLVEESRVHYQAGLQELRNMADKHKQVHDNLRQIAKKLEELEDITIKPTI